MFEPGVRITPLCARCGAAGDQRRLPIAQRLLDRLALTAAATIITGLAVLATPFDSRLYTPACVALAVAATLCAVALEQAQHQLSSAQQGEEAADDL